MSCLGVTGKVRESKFEWEIAKFLSLSAPKGSYYSSPSFVLDKTSLHLSIFPAGHADAKSGFISAYLVNESKDPFHVNITLHIKKTDGTMTGGRSADVCIESSMGYVNFYERSCLQQNESEIMPSGSLTIVCTLKPKHGGKLDIKGEKVKNSLEQQTHKMSDHRRLTGHADAKSGFLSAYLVNESKDPFHVNITLHIKKTDGTMTGGRSADVYIESSMGYVNFYERSCLQQNESEMVPSGSLTIVCTLKPKHDGKLDIIKGEKVKNSHEQQTRKMSDHRRLTELDVLSENLKDLSTNTDSCDTVLQVKDKEFKAHKTILMARSPVFAAMFKHDTLEKQTGFIDIPDCDPDSFQEFLDYLYCGKLEDISNCSAFQLYITSSKYDVQKLKQFCVQYLIESLAVDNVCDIVKLADKYSDEKLMPAVQNFFNENWSKIFVTTEWESLLKDDYRLGNKLLMGFSKAKGSQ